MGALIFQIGDIGISAHLYWRLNKISCRAYYCFLVTKVAFKSSLDLNFHPFIIAFFWSAELKFRIEEKIHSKAVADVSRDNWKIVFLFSWDRMGGGQ